MATNYPGSIDSYARPNTTDPLSNPSHAGIEDNQYDAVEAVETELGTDPAGAQTDVKTRLLLMLQKGSSTTDGARTRDVGLSNLFLNGNFKYFYHGTSGATTLNSPTNCPEGWEGFNTPSTVERVAGVATDPLGVGSFIVKVTVDDVAEGIYINANKWLKVCPSTTYTLSFWYKVGAADDRLVIFLRDYEGANAGTVHLNEVELGGTSWTLYTKTFTTAADADNLMLKFTGKASGDIFYVSGMMLNRGSAPFAYSPHPEDHLYEQTTYHISPMKSLEAYATGLAASEAYHNFMATWLKQADGNIFFPFDISRQIVGKTTCVDEITIFYKITDDDGATTNNADYIDVVMLRSNDQDETITTEVNHTDNLGDDTFNGTGNHNIVDTMYEMTASDHFLQFALVHDTTPDDVLILDIEVKYHRKNHE